MCDLFKQCNFHCVDGKPYLDAYAHSGGSSSNLNACR